MSILLRNVNIDDSGVYRCMIRSSTADENFPAQFIDYRVELTSPRLCQFELNGLPCFSEMPAALSPVIMDAYQTVFLQCRARTYKATGISWIAGSALGSNNSTPLITAYVGINQHNGDRMHRVFPGSVFDYSIEIEMNPDNREQRKYSCVIDGAPSYNSTLFTYILRPLQVQEATYSESDDEEIAETIAGQFIPDSIQTQITTADTPSNSTTVNGEQLKNLLKINRENGKASNDILDEPSKKKTT